MESYVDGLEKNSKSSEARVFALTTWKMSKYGVISGPYFPVFGPEITKNIWTLHVVLKSLRAGAGSFYVKNLPSWNNTNFTQYLSYIIAMKSFVIFLFTLLGILYPSLNWFCCFRKLILIAYISKIICYFCLFICHIRETREHYQRKFKVYRLNLES